MLMTVVTFFGLFGFLAFLEINEEKELVRRYAPKLLANKSDGELFNTLAQEFKDKLTASVWLSKSDGELLNSLGQEFKDKKELVRRYWPKMRGYKKNYT